MQIRCCTDDAAGCLLVMQVCAAAPVLAASLLQGQDEQERFSAAHRVLLHVMPTG
jgi:hypothetical protein